MKNLKFYFKSLLHLVINDNFWCVTGTVVGMILAFVSVIDGLMTIIVMMKNSCSLSTPPAALAFWQIKVKILNLCLQDLQV